ncbi:membrane protein [Streptomyces mashuensis]|uniref:Membrane protein n=1 Tax=Streptomyces mashuensis TaxID=33904 RepID=A0A919AYK3_9ACTN|nr:hypothetical protein [Streptomyces mashuensis]GHF32170.1 membrane protein [Streptomyces mashuensis]
MGTESERPAEAGGSTSGERRRRRRPLAVASVAAAVLLAGGGGAYWAATASDGGGGGAPSSSPAGDGTPPPLQLDEYVGGGPGSGPGGSSQGIAVGEPDPHGVRYVLRGTLPEGPRTAAVYLPEREVTKEQVAALAKALDVQGTPGLKGGTWTVGGDRDGAGPTLQVAEDGPGLWSYTRYGVPGAAHCVKPGGTPEPGPKDTAVPPSPGCPSFRDGSGNGSGDGTGNSGDGTGPVSEDRARSAAAPVLKALGQAGARTDASKVTGALRTVTADPVVDSVRTYGWQTTIQVAADGQVASGSGMLRLPVKGATYPLVTARQALDQLNRGAGTGRPSFAGCATAVPFGDGADRADGPCPGKAGTPEPAAVRSAAFGLSAQTVGGRQALVPSWLFEVALPGTGAGDGTVTVAQPAIDPRFIARRPGVTQEPGGTASPGTAPVSGPARVESWSRGADDKQLVLHFWGGVCSEWSASVPEQSAAAVTVKVTGTEKEPGRPCVMMLKRFDRTVSLDGPLGDRKVVDVSSGETVREQQGK